MSACHDDILHDGPLVAVRDEWCFVRRSGPRGERYARGNTLRFTRAGMYVLHYGAGGRRTIVADGAHVLLSNDGAPYLVSHPTDDGDASIVLDYRDDTVREVAARHDRAAWRDRASPLAPAHVLASTASLLAVHRLRSALLAGESGPLAPDEVALEILDDVLRDAARARDARPVAQRPATRRARRELAEAVKMRLAASPATDVTLPALAREVAASPFHLARTFRAEVGMPIHQYLLRVRLHRGLDRLADPATSLAVLALDLGFASHAHFSATFRRVFGVSPSAARAAIRRERRGVGDAA